MFATQDPWQSPSAPVPQQGSTNQTVAIVSVVLGVVSMPAIFCCSCIASPVPMVGLGLGAYALIDARKRNGDQVLAIVGTVLNGLVLLAMVGFMVFAILSNGVSDLSDFDRVMESDIVDSLDEEIPGEPVPEPVPVPTPENR